MRDVDEYSSSEQGEPPSISMGINAHPNDRDFKEDFQYPLTVEGVDCGEEKNIKDFILGFITTRQCKIVIDISLDDNTHCKCLINNDYCIMWSKYNTYNTIGHIMCMMTIYSYIFTCQYLSFYILAILSTRPDKNELLNLLANIDSDWFRIGTALNVSHNILQGFGQNNETNTVKLTKVINSWITTQSSPVTWQTVIDAIGGNVVNNRAKVNEILEHLGLPN